MDRELIFWIVAGIVGVIAFAVLYAKGVQEDKGYVDLDEWR